MKWIAAKNDRLADKKVLVLEGAPKFKEFSKSKYSNRVTAINRQSVELLKKLDAWNHIESVRCKPILQMQVCSKQLIVDLSDQINILGLGRNIWREHSFQLSELQRTSRNNCRE